MTTTSPTVSVIIPAKNEAANLALVLPLLPAEYEIVLVDGHSTDGTVAVARSIRPDLVLVHQTRKGKGNALACGFLAASGDVVVMFDADCSADPAEIPRFVQALVDGADFAKGSRFTEGGGSEDITRLRQVGNDGLNLIANLGFGTGFTDLCYGYNAFWRDLVPVLDLPDVSIPAPFDGHLLWGDGFEIETVINCRFAASGARVVEVPSVEKLRVHGESNLHTFRDGFRVLRTIAAEYRRMRAGRRGARSLHRALLAPRSDLIQDLVDAA